MNNLFRKTAISLVVASMTTLVYAGAPQMNGGGFYIGVEGLDLRAMNGDLDYYSVFTTTENSTHAISTDWDWGWRVYGGLMFGDNDDFSLSWFQLRSTSSDSNGALGVGNFVRGIGFSNTSTSAKVTFDVDEAYGVLGHTIHFNNPWSLRFAGGVAYARVDSDLKVYAADGLVTPDSVISKSTMNGWGPRGEFDISYNLGFYDLALFANTNISLFVANRDISADSYLEGVFDSTSDFSNRNVIVPKLGMRLGLSYTWMMGQAGAEGACGSALTLAAGWQVESYIHAVERVTVSEDFVAATKVSNFGDQGLFLGLTFSSSWM